MKLATPPWGPLEVACWGLSDAERGTPAPASSEPRLGRAAPSLPDFPTLRGRWQKCPSAYKAPITGAGPPDPSTASPRLTASAKVRLPRSHEDALDANRGRALFTPVQAEEGQPPALWKQQGRAGPKCRNHPPALSALRAAPSLGHLLPRRLPWFTNCCCLTKCQNHERLGRQQYRHLFSCQKKTPKQTKKLGGTEWHRQKVFVWVW